MTDRDGARADDAEELMPDAIGDRRPRIAVVTGTRAEFGLLERSIELLRSNAAWHVDVVVAGMHLVPELGATVRDVETHFPIARRVAMTPPEDSPRGMGLAVSEGLSGFLGALGSLRPDLLLVLGDRTEAFAAALSAAYLDVPVAHIHGGDVSGNPIDNFQRDAISRMARLHLAASGQSAVRLGRLGVDGDVIVVGAPGLDAIVAHIPPPIEEVAARLELPKTPWMVVLHHPPQREPESAASEMDAVLEAATAIAVEQDVALAAVYPNNDAGHRGIVEAIRRRERRGQLTAFRSLPREDWLALLAHARLLVGNSSSGIIDSASLGLAVVNVGERQRDRERNPNVVDAEPRVAAIVDAARWALTEPSVQEVLQSRSNLYGDGHASERIVVAIERFVRTLVPAPEDVVEEVT